jgi:hypothetical protein
MTTDTSNGNLTVGQIAFSICYGAALWLGAAMLVRALGPMGILEGWLLAVAFVALVPVTIPAVLFTQKVVGPSRERLLASVSLITATALCLDGIGFGFFPALYGSEPTHVIGGAALILFGGGVGLILALVIKWPPAHD